MGRGIFVIFLITAEFCSAQLETSQWYFGANAGLDFTTSPPTVVSNTNINSAGGTSSMSDTNGNLLFYTDGMTIWNKQHQVMANGTGLSNIQSEQNVVILPDMAQPNLFHIWTVNPLQQTTVDMNLAAGLGSVTVKNYTVSNFSSTGKQVTASSGCGIAWLTNRNSANYNGHSYFQNSDGSSGWGVTFSQIPPNTYKDLWIKFSPSGKRLGIVSEETAFGPGNYYVALGYAGGTWAFGNPNSFFVLSSGSDLGDLFSCEFSPDCSKFYVSSPGTHSIYQWDLCAGSDSAIINSLYTISTGTTSVYGLQLAPDGKLYCASNPSLSVINHPDLAGAACGFTAQQQSIGTASCGFALPNFSSYYFSKPLGPVSFSFEVDTVACKTATFSISSPSTFSNCLVSLEGISALKWNFSDPISGAANTSTLPSVTHTFSGPGVFPVQVVIERGCKKDTITHQVNIPGPWPVFSLAGKATICKNETATITATGTDSYLWAGSLTGSVFVVSPSVTTTYTVVGKNNSSGCELRSTFSITVLPCTSVSKMPYHEHCKLHAFQNNDLLMISLNGSETCPALYKCSGVSLIDMSGRIILRGEPDWKGAHGSLDISSVTPGLYFLSLDPCSGVSPIRVVLNR